MTNELPSDDLMQPDPADTVRLPVRVSVLAQIEAALLAEKNSLSDTGIRRRGKDPYNNTLPTLRDTKSIKN